MLDEIKIKESSDCKSFSNPFTNKDLQPDNVWLPPPQDFVWILHLSPTVRFFREHYINTFTFNGSPLLAFAFSC
jgi:hypothetical protein